MNEKNTNTPRNRVMKSADLLAKMQAGAIPQAREGRVIGKFIELIWTCDDFPCGRAVGQLVHKSLAEIISSPGHNRLELTDAGRQAVQP